MSILDTLITNRTSADVSRAKDLNKKGFAAMTEAEKAEYLVGLKGAYNATDINRVGEACEYVANRLHQYGYAVDVQKIPHYGDSRYATITNLVQNGSFESSDGWSTWSASAIIDYATPFGSKALRLTGDELAQRSVQRPIVGHTYYGREYIKTDGEVTIGDGRFEVHGGDGDGLNWVYGWNRGNFPTWTIQSNTYTIEVVNAQDYVLRTFKVGGSGTAYIDGIMLVDLTESFGAGNEPSKDWCDENIPFILSSGQVLRPVRYEWVMSDIPTPNEMSVYIANIQHLRDVFTLIAPQAPDDADQMTYEEANNIEKILIAVDELLERVIASFVYSGQTFSGIVWEALT